MLKKLYFFDSVVTSNDVPLPLSTKETIILSCKNVGFGFYNKNSFQFASIQDGTVFLTNMRFIFIPKSKQNFQSFFTPLNMVFSIKKDCIECMCDDNSIGSVCLIFNDGSQDLFNSEFKKALSSVTIKTPEDNEDSVPFYCEIAE